MNLEELETIANDPQPIGLKAFAARMTLSMAQSIVEYTKENGSFPVLVADTFGPHDLPETWLSETYEGVGSLLAELAAESTTINWDYRLG